MAILAAIDENERSKQVVRIGYDLATAYDDTLVGLHVIPTEDFESHQNSIRDIPEFHDFSVTQEEDAAKRFVREFVSQVLDDFDRRVLETRGRVGNPANEILGLAREIEPRFLVISGRRRSPAGKAIFGNTAQRIILNADCPVVSKVSDS